MLIHKLWELVIIGAFLCVASLLAWVEETCVLEAPCVSLELLLLCFKVVFRRAVSCKPLCVCLKSLLLGFSVVLRWAVLFESLCVCLELLIIEFCVVFRWAVLFEALCVSLELLTIGFSVVSCWYVLWIPVLSCLFLICVGAWICVITFCLLDVLIVESFLIVGYCCTPASSYFIRWSSFSRFQSGESIPTLKRSSGVLISTGLSLSASHKPCQYSSIPGRDVSYSSLFLSHL